MSQTTHPDEALDTLQEPVLGRLSVQEITLAVAGVFVIVGVLGFIPGVTTHAMPSDGLRFSGDHSEAMLFGVFMVSVLHNFVHLAFGAIGAVSSFFARTATLYFLIGGVVYLALWIYGIAADPQGSANFVPLDTADNWLHFGLGVLMIGLGVLLTLRIRKAVREDAERQEAD